MAYIDPYAEMTQEQFDRILRALLMDRSALDMLSIPGIYEVLSEHFNNEVLDWWQEQQDDIAALDATLEGHVPRVGGGVQYRVNVEDYDVRVDVHDGRITDAWVSQWDRMVPIDAIYEEQLTAAARRLVRQLDEGGTP